MIKIVKLEVFTAKPPCPGCSELLKLADEIEEEYGEEVEVVKNEGPCDELEKYEITVVPAAVIDEKIKIMGVCPSKESLRTALWEAGA
ncbi:hypothetical protein AKJ51_01340 [candidate division MSBL1 archaeon SCGC-AAA382A20]|uniref:Thioredoxin-like fold domain-containing protein n=1 Tax=candidate division MSBL1 archaeon SCGC-AAA382A20 TaxID=1698280 RepID=A0A133VM14_9EURY|nr:hypothetical protein AKJ51_01340 [candidate division MSBL1 archaeon SCGC-AAA382A20]